MLIRARAIGRALAFALALHTLVCAPWAADSYPVRSIRWVVPWSAGGIADTQARIIAEHLSRALGQQVIVDNRAGATGMLGADVVAKARPDGYTLLYVSQNEQAIAQAAGLKVSYNAETDFTPITQFVHRPAVLVADPSLNVRTVAELAAYVKARKGEVSYGTPGVAHFSHFVGEVFNRRMGIVATPVPYKGEAPMIVDLMGGQVAYGFGYATTVDPAVRAGRLRALATTGKARSPQLPGVSTFVELGMPEMTMTSWNGMAGPAGLPPDIVQRLQVEIGKVLRNPAVNSRREFADSEIIASKPEEFRAFLAAERARWIKLVKQTGITME
ncbi:MAG TPA: tripartite tricarboxylate transporter substrate binding protein [Burkholderiales bacterium]|nr:tripartite tricarboxylate transporter substrate binding protein [Burkholderiales bacterium]